MKKAMDVIYDAIEKRVFNDDSDPVSVRLGVLREAHAVYQVLGHKIRGYQHHLRECEQLAGKALGYPWYKDDAKNFPDATEEDGVCVGEHVGDTIVQELANRYEEALARIQQLESPEEHEK